STKLDLTNPANPAPHIAQEIPPATRRAVLRRDRDRCVVDGCRNSVWVDLHHTELKSEGGTHDPEKILTLCTAHHSQAHQGRLLIRGTASTGFTFEHADGTPYGGEVDTATVGIMKDAYDALRALGYKHKVSMDTLDELRTHVGNRGSIA